MWLYPKSKLSWCNTFLQIVKVEYYIENSNFKFSEVAIFLKIILFS